MDLEPFLLSLGACLLAMNFRTRERRDAMMVAAALLVNWAVCQWTYADYSPWALIGIPGTMVWAMADAIFGAVAIIVGLRRWWGWPLWFCATMQVAAYTVYFVGSISVDTYLGSLTFLLRAEFAVFLFGGWRGVWIGLHRFHDRGGFRGRKAFSTHARTRRSDDR